MINVIKKPMIQQSISQCIKLTCFYSTRMVYAHFRSEGNQTVDVNLKFDLVEKKGRIIVLDRIKQLLQYRIF